MFATKKRINFKPNDRWISHVNPCHSFLTRKSSLRVAWRFILRHSHIFWKQNATVYNHFYRAESRRWQYRHISWALTHVCIKICKFLAETRKPGDRVKTVSITCIPKSISSKSEGVFAKLRLTEVPLVSAIVWAAITSNIVRIFFIQHNFLGKIHDFLRLSGGYSPHLISRLRSRHSGDWGEHILDLYQFSRTTYQ